MAKVMMSVHEARGRLPTSISKQPRVSEGAGEAKEQHNTSLWSNQEIGFLETCMSFPVSKA